MEIIIIIIWLISPFVLIPLFIVFLSKDSKNRKIIYEKDKKLREYERQLSELRHLIENKDEMISEQASVQGTETESISDQISVQEKAIDMISEQTSVQDTEIDSITAQIPTQNRTVVEIPYNRVAKDSGADDKNDHSGRLLFGIGVALVLIAGTVFATTTWNTLTAIGKISVMMSTVAVFYLSAYIADTKFDLRETSIAFFALGSGAIAFINLAAGYFGLYGEAYSGLKGKGGFIWAITSLIIAVCMLIGRFIYDTAVLGTISYGFLLLAVLEYIFSYKYDNEIKSIVIGVFFIISVLLLRTVQKNGYPNVSSTLRFAKVLIFPYVFMSFLIEVVTYIVQVRRNYSVFPDLAVKTNWTLIAMGMVQLITIAVSYFDSIGVLRNEHPFWQESMADSDILDRQMSTPGRKGKNSTNYGVLPIYPITLLISVTGMCMCFCIPRYRVSWIIMLIIFAICLKRHKNESLFIRNDEAILRGGALISAYVISVISLFEILLFGIHSDNIFFGVILVLCSIQYILKFMDRSNSSAWITAFVFYFTTFVMIEANLGDGIGILTKIAVLEIPVAITVIAGWIFKRKIVSRGCYGDYKIEWCSLAAGALNLFILFRAFESGNDKAIFLAGILLAAYLLTFYSRVEKTFERAIFAASAIVFTLCLAFQPFFTVPGKLVSEWAILMILFGMGLILLIYRHAEVSLIGVQAVAISACFLVEFGAILCFADSGNAQIVLLKLILYLVGVLVVFIKALLTRSNLWIVLAGAALAFFSFLAGAVDSKGIFIIAALIGICYMVYLLMNDKSEWTFLPLAQCYILMFTYVPADIWWIVVFVVLTAVGLFLRFRAQYAGEGYDIYHEKKTSIDLITLSAGIPVLYLIMTGGEASRCIGFIMMAVYFACFYKRFDEDGEAIVNRRILTAVTVALLIAWGVQPWITVSEYGLIEYWSFGLMTTAFVNMIFIYKADTDEPAGWITFLLACGCSLVQYYSVLALDRVADALILGIVMMLTLIAAFIFKRKQWFILSAVTILLLALYATWDVWTSLAWWVYLLVAGAILIIVASVNEYNKRNNIEGFEKDHKRLFENWRY
ncbi:MAG: hypothetical protein K5662_05570 [Lachnospiraceae bacterium]|nr:hypothetical protein [Lachnospiraceae bacterium]